MQITDETKAWATRKLIPFAKWRGFPETPDELEMRVRSFLRLVHNKPVRDILPRTAADGSPMKYPLDPDTNDVDWILDTIAETDEYFPLPSQMRDMYKAKLPPYWEPKGA